MIDAQMAALSRTVVKVRRYEIMIRMILCVIKQSFKAILCNCLKWSDDKPKCALIL
jgi:hypothetical protein